MEKCKLKKGDRIYECRYHEATLTELIEDPKLRVQGEDSHYWHWKARVIETNSHNVVPGDIVEFGILEEAPQYGPRLYRKNVYEVGVDKAEQVLPPFDTTREVVIRKVSISDDIEILINGKNAKSFASQGQQRSAVLSLKLAEAAVLKERMGEEPVILLDDVLSELDGGRQDFLLNELKDCQVFITCCEKSNKEQLKKGTVFEVSEGTISEMS